MFQQPRGPGRLVRKREARLRTFDVAESSMERFVVWAALEQSNFRERVMFWDGTPVGLGEGAEDAGDAEVVEAPEPEAAEQDQLAESASQDEAHNVCPLVG